MKDFSERLNKILGGRQKHPWGQALGISQGVISTMFEGGIPTADTLSTISRVENVSLDWLLDGRGMPFRISEVDDSENAQIIEDAIDEEPAEALYLANSKGRAFLMLTQHIKFQQPKKEAIDYVDVSMMGGDIGPLTMEAISHALGSLSVRLLDLPPEFFERLASGHMGNAELLPWKKQPGLLADYTEIKTRQDLNEYLAARYLPSADPTAPRAKVHLIQDIVYSNMAQLNQDHMQVAEATVKALLEAEGKEWKDVY